MIKQRYKKPEWKSLYCCHSTKFLVNSWQLFWDLFDSLLILAKLIKVDNSTSSVSLAFWSYGQLKKNSSRHCKKDAKKLSKTGHSTLVFNEMFKLTALWLGNWSWSLQKWKRNLTEIVSSRSPLGYRYWRQRGLIIRLIIICGLQLKPR